MKTIVPAAELVLRILGRQKRQPGAAYRLLRFCIQCPVEEGTLLYNPMTLELLLLSTGENIPENEELIARWFLVPEEQDDEELADQLRDLSAHLQKPIEHITAYTVFTTTDCNARCYYCFEQGCKRQHMSRDTALELVRYIGDHSGGERVNLHWFGGEPLLRQEVIDTICQGLTDAGIPYRSTIATNGYLLDRATIQKATSLWKLQKAQITLDGTEEVYNQTKAFIRPEGSPFRRVLGNMDALLEAGIQVSVRLNVGEENAQDLLCLAEQLAENFKGKNGFLVYPSPLYEQGENDQWVFIHSPALTEKYKALKERLIQLNLYREQRLARNIRLRHCIACNDGAAVVLPDGSLGCCEHFTDTEIFGHIGQKTKDTAMIEAWKERTLPGPECGNCSYYPQCFRLKKCPGGRTCAPAEHEMTEEQLRTQIRMEYERYKNRQANC